MSMFGVMALLAALEAGAGAATVTVESDSPCPSAHAVQKALDALGGRNAPRPASATLRSRGDRLTVEFSWPGTPQSETRELAVESDCESRAQSAAVVIASWLGILPEATLVSTPLGAAPAEIPYAMAAPGEPEKSAAEQLPTAASSTDVAARPVEADPTGADEVLSGQRSEDRSLSSRRYWLGVGLTGSAGGGVVPGLRIELLRARARAGFDLGWMASTLVSMPRSKSLEGGTSSWIRPALGLEGLASWGGPCVQWAMDLGPLVALTVAWGSGYPINQTDESPTWGLTGGLRLQVALASSRLWAELRIIDWLHGESLQHEIQPTGIASLADLPSLEGILSLGWSLGI